PSPTARSSPPSARAVPPAASSPTSTPRSSPSNDPASSRPDLLEEAEQQGNPLPGKERMLRSMFSAIGGLKSHQTMMDVTANNIANVNTLGYQSQRVTFASMLSQNVRGASAPVQGGQGGVNPTQVGLGVSVSGTQTMLTQGSAQTTGQWSDMRID